MNQKSKTLVKNVGLFTISNFASKILVFLLVPLYTSVLSTTEYGAYDLCVSTVNLLYPILTLNIADAVMRFSMDKDEKINDIAQIGFRFIVLSCIIAGGLLFIIVRLHIWNDTYNLVAFIFAYYVLHAFNSFLIQFAKGLEKVTDMAIAGIMGTVVMVATNMFFLLVLKLGLKGFFLANIISTASTVLYFFIRLKVYSFINIVPLNQSLMHNMLLYCTPLIATVLGWWINSAFDKYTVALICGVAANGILSVSYKIPQIINTLQSIFIQAWQISAIKEYGEEDTKEFYGRTFSVINVMMAAACSWLIILAKPIGHILYQKEFYVAWQYVPFLLIASVLNSASGFLGPILSAKKASKPMAMSAVYGASANVVMNSVFVYLIGIQGATIATVISSFIIYAVRKHAVGDEIEIKGYGIVLITWALLCVQAVLEIYTPFWWAEAILMIVMLAINRKEISEMMKTGKNLIHK